MVLSDPSHQWLRPALRTKKFPGIKTLMHSGGKKEMETRSKPASDSVGKEDTLTEVSE